LFLGRKGMKPAPHTKEFPHTGQIRCAECSCQITAENKTQVICRQCKFKFAYPYHEKCPKCEVLVSEMVNPKFLRYEYYHCTKRKNTDTKKCSQQCVTGKALRDQIIKF